MAGNVRAGTAYIDVVLGSTEKFFGPLREKLKGAGEDAARNAGNSFAKEFATNRAAYSNLRNGLKEAIDGSGLTGEELKRRLGEAGKGGADGFLREFGPLMRNGILNISGEARQKLLEALDTGTMSPRLVNMFKQALGEIANESERTAGRSSSAMSRISSAASAAGRSISTSFNQAHNGLKHFSEGLSNASYKVMQFGYTATAGLTAPIAGLTALGTAIGIKVAADIEVAAAAFQTFLGSADAAQAMIRQLRDFSNQSPLFDTSSAIDFAQRLLAVGVASNRIMPSMQALEGLASMYGVSQDKLSNALVGMTQTLAKNKVYMEEIRQVEEAGIPVIQVLAQALGKTQAEVTEMIKEGKISADEYYAAIVKVGTSEKALASVQRRAETLTGIWNQFKETVQSRLADAVEPHLDRIKKALEKVGGSLDKALKNAGPLIDRVVGGFEKLAGGLEKAINWYDKLSPKQQEFVNKMLGIAAAVGPATIVLGSVSNAIGALSGVLAFLLTPAGLVVLAILAIVGSIIYLWQTSPKFREFVQNVIDKAQALYDKLKPVAKEIADAWNEHMKPALEGVWDVIKNRLWPAVKDLMGEFDEEDRKRLIDTANVVKDVLTVVFIIMAFVINNILKPALEWLSDFLKKHKDEVRELKDQYGDLMKALMIIAAVIVGSVVVALFILAAAFLLVVGVIGLLLYSIWWLFNELGKLWKRFSDWAAGVEDSARRTRNAMTGLPGQIVAAFATLNLWNIGWNAVQGLINGLRAHLPSAEQVARNIGWAIYNAAANAIGVRSPSRAFMQLGRYVIEGLVIGLSDDRPAIKASANLARSTIAGFGSPALATAGGGIQPASNYVVVKVGERTVDDLVVESSRRRREDIANAVEVGNTRLARRR